MLNKRTIERLHCIMLASKFIIILIILAHFSKVHFLKEHGQCTCTHNMPPTLLRMLLILRPHLLQIFVSHLIISGCGHLQRLSHTCTCHNVCCCFNLLMYCLNRCCHSRVGIGNLLHVLCTHSNTAICFINIHVQRRRKEVLFGGIVISLRAQRTRKISVTPPYLKVKVHVCC